MGIIRIHIGQNIKPVTIQLAAIIAKIYATSGESPSIFINETGF